MPDVLGDLTAILRESARDILRRDNSVSPKIQKHEEDLLRKDQHHGGGFTDDSSGSTGVYSRSQAQGCRRNACSSSSSRGYGPVCYRASTSSSRLTKVFSSRSPQRQSEDHWQCRRPIDLSPDRCGEAEIHLGLAWSESRLSIFGCNPDATAVSRGTKHGHNRQIRPHIWHCIDAIQPHIQHGHARARLPISALRVEASGRGKAIMPIHPTTH